MYDVATETLSTTRQALKLSFSVCSLRQNARRSFSLRLEKRVQCGKVKAKLGRKTKVSSSGFREGNVGNDALHVIGLYGLGDKISFFLKDWELAKVALSCHGP